MIASSVVLGDPMGSREGEQQMVQAKNQIDFASKTASRFLFGSADPRPKSGTGRFACGKRAV